MYLLNGEKAEHISIADRGLAYGDGLFETILVVDGSPILWNEHLARLRLGCELLRIPYDVDGDSLLERLAELLAGNKEMSARYVLKIILTRGSGGRGYALPEPHRPVEIMGLFAAPDVVSIQAQGGSVRTLESQAAEYGAYAGLKHLNRLEQVMAAIELDGQSFEGLMFDGSGCLVEGTRTNIFLWDEEKIFTPTLAKSGVKGVLRQYILNNAPEWGLRIDEADIARAKLKKIKGMALVNSVMGVIPVNQLDGKLLNIDCVIKELQEKVHKQIPF
ncbi:4-amino-4-deoxychorismate lyase [Hahella chejuensis KCTC 2396]|uniref:Aminodeoxychorismate lyase n=1 Tax=Hahella chejuensis (strain KCTC 2396) TaxID=349521 RepID=Q2SK48_HAHCH|nr:aminodeoxychorismate lyase [Hahella chejuensis]ABC28976.1 4-amino-4-deoxychorismate lyase [Hahella chejuensis KCTC 2396]